MLETAEDALHLAALEVGIGDHPFAAPEDGGLVQFVRPPIELVGPVGVPVEPPGPAHAWADQPVGHHQDAHRDQDQGPQIAPPHMEEAQVDRQQHTADPDQDSAHHFVLRLRLIDHLENAPGDQRHRPVLKNVMEPDDVQIIQKEDSPDGDQDQGRNPLSRQAFLRRWLVVLWCHDPSVRRDAARGTCQSANAGPPPVNAQGASADAGSETNGG